jgi:hypothetical protein
MGCSAIEERRERMKLTALQPITLVGIPEGKKTPGMPKCGLEDIIRMDRESVD